MDDGSSFDDVILQVFEEHVDKFTFPLATHKEARDFVRLLNRKGVTYEMVAEEVEEKLNYFENWRLISGEDNAIGNKVLKRLNEPLQDTMGEDDEDNDVEMDKVKQLLFNGRSVDLDDDAAEATLKALDEKRHSKALEAIREAEKQKAAEAKETEAKKAAEAKEAQAKKAAEAKETEAKRAAEAKETEAKKATEAKEIEAKKAEVKKAEAKKESVESDNKVTKKQEEKTKPDAKVSATETDNKEKATNTSVKQPNKQESEKVAEAKNSTVAKEPSTQAKESKSDSSKPTEKPTTAKSSTEEKVTAKVEDKSKTSTTTSLPEKSTAKKAEDSKATSSPTETSSPSKSDKEPPTSSVTVLKSVGSPSSTASSSKPDNTKQPTSPSTTSPSTKTTESKDSSKSSETPPTTKSVNGVTGADVKPSTISLKVPSEPAKSEASSPTSPSTPASKSTPTPTTPSTPDTNLNLTPPGEINENYDSDLDGEEAGYKSDQAKLIDAVNKFKGSVKDGPGYVYILSDTTGSKPVADLTGIHRVRIGASRFPQKRAKQASTFNPDLKLVTSKHVTHRKASLSKIQEELSSILYRGTPFWYRGAIDKILEALEALI